MADVTHEPAGTVADDLFDKYLLPKAALAVILAASLVGTALTLDLAGQWSPLLALAKWAYLVALGVLLGGLLWKHGFVRPGDVDAAGDYCAELYRRFDRIAAGALAVLAVTGVASLAVVYADAPLAIRAALAAALAATLAAGAVDAADDAPVPERFRTPAGVLALAGAVLTVSLSAVADVALAGGGLVPAASRVVHLLAFAAWVGGAVWNIFVAVPTGQLRPTPAVVQAAGEQLERFRWTVRFVIPTLVLTGAYQSVDALGTSVGTYVGTTVGLAVLAKLGFVAVLFAIFLACPMWRACSPIDGVCDLDDAEVGD
ncbi:CopD family protein [Halobacterium hubeiense]|uniref:CopD family protein n=1 Tax=Halobacterium hubeiense TaxID=1407499 RepID=UPI003C729D62